MSADADIDSLVATLQAAFPAHTSDTVAKALTAEHYDIDATAEKLLLLQPGSKCPQQQQQRRRSTRFSSQPEASGARLGWQALTEQRNRTLRAKHPEPQLGFAGQSKAPVVNSPASFPALPQTPQRLSQSGATTSKSPAKPSTPERSPEQGNSRRFAEVARPASRSLLGSARRPGAAADTAGTDRLRQVHKWADAALVKDLLREVQQDEAAADFLLRSMASSAVPGPSASAVQSRETLTPISTPEGTASDPSTDDAVPATAKSDIYQKHRRNANQLTRKWRKAVRHAATAYASGDHSGAQHASKQAQQMREAALLAHEQASRLIEHEHNDARSLGSGVLDLHGLHANEAVAAVDRRLCALRAQRQGPGHHQELQIIVGIGSHSSEGEGSLGRVIESHLLGSNQAFRKRGGVIILDSV